MGMKEVGESGRKSGGICLLDPVTVNQIAAGEVVERPSAALKELIENAIDAGATRIRIDLERSGRSLIRVTDNGCGMSASAMGLAILRHATSKIKRASDLQHIATLGFRGEALPSIASVSRFTLKSAEADGVAHRMEIVGGEIESVQNESGVKGTEVTVRDLFFNTPARLKFLKSENVELGACLDVANRLALSHPSIAFTVKHGVREVFRTDGSGNLYEAIAGIWNREIASGLAPVEGEAAGIHFRGYVSPPYLTKPTRAYQFLYVNGRAVKSRSLTIALDQAYRDMTPERRFPIVVLDLVLDPEWVDVNVSPTKSEVRFQREGAVFEALRMAVRSALLEQGMIPNARAVATVNEALASIARPSGPGGSGYGPDRSFATIPGGPTPLPLLTDPSFRTYRAGPDFAGSNSPGSGLAGLDSVGSDSAGSGFAGQDIIGSDSAGLGSAGQDIIGSDSAGLDSVGLDIPGSGSAGPGFIGSDFAGLGSVGLDIPGAGFAGGAGAAHHFSLGRLDERRESAPMEGGAAGDRPGSERGERIGSLTGPDQAETQAMWYGGGEQIELPAGNDRPMGVDEWLRDPAQRVLGGEATVPAAGPLPFASLMEDLRVIGQAMNTFIIAETRHGIILIDQHVAHERVLFEHLYRSKGRGALETQRLLTPLLLPLDKRTLVLLGDRLQEVKEAGFEVEPFGTDGELLIRAVPAVMRGRDPMKFVKSLIEDIAEGVARHRTPTCEQVWAMASCKMAVKAGDPLGIAEMTKLIEDLAVTDNPYLCPHGRPITVTLDRYQLLKLFKRV